MGKVTKSFMVGATLGVIAALLLAPRTGTQTQKLWRAKYKKVHDQIAREVRRAKTLSAKQYELIVNRALKVADKTASTKTELAALKRDLLANWKALQKKMKK